MKRFRFPLEAVMTLRQRQEQRALEEYGCAVRAHAEAVEQLAAAQAELDRAWDQWRVRMAAGGDAGELIKLDAWRQAVDLRRQSCVGTANQAAQFRTAALNRWLAARRQREATDKLLERLRLQHAQQTRREEQKILDDLNNSRFVARPTPPPTAEIPWN